MCLLQGVLFESIPSRSTLVTTDSSLTDWAAVLDGRTVSGVWRPLLEWRTHQCPGTETVHLQDVSYQSPGQHLFSAFPPGGTEAPVLCHPVFGFSKGNLYYRSCESGSRPSVQSWSCSRREVVALFVHSLRLGSGDLFASSEMSQDVVLSDRSGRFPWVWMHCQEWTEGFLYVLPPCPLLPWVLNRISLGYNKVLLKAQWPRKHWFLILHGTLAQLSCSCGLGPFTVPLSVARQCCPEDHKQRQGSQLSTSANYDQKWKVFSWWCSIYSAKMVGEQNV